VDTEIVTVTGTLLSAIEDITTQILDLGIRSGTWTRKEAYEAMEYCRQSMSIHLQDDHAQPLDAATLVAVAGAVKRIADGLYAGDDDNGRDVSTLE